MLSVAPGMEGQHPRGSLFLQGLGGHEAAPCIGATRPSGPLLAAGAGVLSASPGAECGFCEVLPCGGAAGDSGCPLARGCNAGPHAGCGFRDLRGRLGREALARERTSCPSTQSWEPEHHTRAGVENSVQELGTNPSREGGEALAPQSQASTSQDLEGGGQST